MGLAGTGTINRSPMCRPGPSFRREQTKQERRTMINSITDWKHKALRLQGQIQNFREQGLAVAERGANVGLAGVGAVGATFSAVYLPVIPGTQVPTDLAIGGAIAALGVFD